MKYSRKKLLDLMDAGDRVLGDPENDAGWRGYQALLDDIEREEAGQPRQPEAQNKPSIVPRSSALLLSAVAVIALIGLCSIGYSSGALDTLAALLTGATATLTPTLAIETLTPVPVAITATLDARPTVTAGQMPGALTATQLMAQHRLDGTAGETISVRLDAVGFDPYLTLLDVNGLELVSDDDCGPINRACIGPVMLPSDGVYLLVVDSYDRRSTGTYTLTVEIEPSVAPPTPTQIFTPTASAAELCPDADVTALIVTNEPSINLRNGPNASYAPAGIAYPGECFEVVARNADTTWIRIRIASGRQAWVLARLAQITGDAAVLPEMDQ